MILVVVLACLAAAVVSAPQGNERHVDLANNQHNSGDVNFNYAFEADNGISVSVSGSRGAAGQVNMRGLYKYTLANGTPVQVRFFADDKGFHPELDLLLRLLHFQPVVLQPPSPPQQFLPPPTGQFGGVGGGVGFSGGSGPPHPGIPLS